MIKRLLTLSQLPEVVYRAYINLKGKKSFNLILQLLCTFERLETKVDITLESE